MKIFIAEMMGTALMVLIGSGITASVLAKQSENKDLERLTIAFGWGLGYTIAIYAVLGLSNTCFNPALTIGFYLMNPKEYNLAPYLLGQITGAFIGASIVAINFYQIWSQSKPSEGKTKRNATNVDIRLRSLCSCPNQPLNVSNFFSELTASIILITAITGAFLGLEDSYVEKLTPVFSGISFALVILFLSGTTGGTTNPAVDLAGRFIYFLLPLQGKREIDWGYAWIPIIAPIIGSSIGSWLYLSYILFKYE